MKRVNMKKVFLVCVMVCGFATFVSAQSPPTPRWYRGMIHMHTYWSDGRGFPEQAVDAYKQRGYDFIAMSDHNRFATDTNEWRDVCDIPLSQAGWPPKLTADIFAAYTNAFSDSAEVRVNNGTTQIRLKNYAEIKTQFEETGKFLLMPGCEITDKITDKVSGWFGIHMNYVNLPLVVPSVANKEYINTLPAGSTVSGTIGDIAVEVAAAAADLKCPYLLMLNHPQWVYYDVLPQHLIDHPEVRFFEVCNNGSSYAPDPHLAGFNNDRFWDAVLAWRMLNNAPLLYGLGSDDAHFYLTPTADGGSYPGDAWVMVRSPSLTPEALIAAMDAGDFYATCGVTLEDVVFSKPTRTLHVKVQAEANVNYTIHFITTKRGFDQTISTVTATGGYGTRTLPVYSADIGRTVKTVTGIEGAYQMAADDLYVRARIDSDRAAQCTQYLHPTNQCAWTQPYK